MPTERLRVALKAAMKDRDQVAVAALRSTLAALANAEAVQRSADADRNLAIGQIPVGAGAAEAERRALTRTESEAIVRTEIAERREAAAQFEQAGQHEHAERLIAEAAVIERQLTD
ncbi:GatB/YqeY domain-containing protein [Streptomyces sp. O3]